MAIEMSKMTFAVTGPQYKQRLLYFKATTGTQQVETITADTFANSGQGDFVVIYNAAGDAEAIWLDKDAAGTAPTADLFNTCNIRSMASITTGDDEIAVAAAIFAASTITGVTLLDNTDGTITVTQDYGKDVSDIEVSNADGSGAGSISAAVVTPGVTPVLTNGKFDAAITQTGAGTYVLTFVDPFLRSPECVVTTITDNRVPRITASTTLAVTIEMQNLSGGAEIAGSFSCLVTGSDYADAIN